MKYFTAIATLLVLNIITVISLLYIGTELFVFSLKDISVTYGVPEAIIGLSIAAVGTSLPEIVVSISSAINKQERIEMTIFGHFWVDLDETIIFPKIIKIN